MGDRHLARQFAGRAILVDVNPLFVAGCFSEGVDAVLAYFDPLARANSVPAAVLSSSKSLKTRIRIFSG
jgi:hypothetical protein